MLRRKNIKQTQHKWVKNYRTGCTVDNVCSVAEFCDGGCDGGCDYHRGVYTCSVCRECRYGWQINGKTTAKGLDPCIGRPLKKFKIEIQPSVYGHLIMNSYDERDIIIKGTEAFVEVEDEGEFTHLIKIISMEEIKTS